MSIIVTVLAGFAVMAAIVIVPFLLGLPFIRYAHRRGYLPYPEVEDNWFLGAVIILLIGLAYFVGSVII